MKASSLALIVAQCSALSLSGNHKRCGNVKIGVIKNWLPTPALPHNHHIQNGALSSALYASSVSEQGNELSDESNKVGIFSSIRGAIRQTTGLSLTTTRAACRAATGISISSLFARVLSIFPLILRFFFQPFLIIYYTPLFLARAFVGPSKDYKAEQQAAHEKLVQGWRDAVVAAEKLNEGGYWPVHVDGMYIVQ